MKLIFMPIINDDHYLASCAVVVTVAAIIGAPLWGCIGDHKGFKFTLMLVVMADLFCKLLGLFCT
jgi:predicted MFS family arabinose efflux permease